MMQSRTLLEGMVSGVFEFVEGKAGVLMMG